jgi:hypothetical protein
MSTLQRLRAHAVGTSAGARAEIAVRRPLA